MVPNWRSDVKCARKLFQELREGASHFRRLFEKAIQSAEGASAGLSGHGDKQEEANGHRHFASSCESRVPPHSPLKSAKRLGSWRNQALSGSVRCPFCFLLFVERRPEAERRLASQGQGKRWFDRLTTLSNVEVRPKLIGLPKDNRLKWDAPPSRNCLAFLGFI